MIQKTLNVSRLYKQERTAKNDDNLHLHVSVTKSANFSGVE